MFKSKHWSTLLAITTALVLFVSACGAAATPTPPAVAPVAAPTMAPAPTTAPAAAPTASTAAAGATAIMVAHTTDFGDILTDGKGMTLYIYTKDSPGKTVCYDACAKAWPPLTVSDGKAPAAPAGAMAKFGVIDRTDGTKQVTYNDMPLYYYVKDTKAGDTIGQNVGGVWFIVPASGDFKLGTGSTGSSSSTAAAASGLIMVAHSTDFGDILTDNKGMTLYIYTKDSPGKTVCYDNCAKAWPPLVVADGKVPAAPAGATAKFGVIDRTDGTKQITYNDMPLYYYVKDTKAGDTTGQNVGGVWFIVPASGDFKLGGSTSNAGGYGSNP